MPDGSLRREIVYVAPEFVKQVDGHYAGGGILLDAQPFHGDGMAAIFPLIYTGREEQRARRCPTRRLERCHPAGIAKPGNSSGGTPAVSRARSDVQVHTEASADQIEMVQVLPEADNGGLKDGVLVLPGLGLKTDPAGAVRADREE